jgi:hypothetical protein
MRRDGAKRCPASGSRHAHAHLRALVSDPLCSTPHYDEVDQQAPEPPNTTFYL